MCIFYKTHIVPQVIVREEILSSFINFPKFPGQDFLFARHKQNKPNHLE